MNEGNKTYRPFEVDVELDGRPVDGQVVGAEHRGDLLAEGAALVEVDHRLVVLEADSELCLTSSGARAAESVLGLAAVAVDVTGVEVTELLEAQLEDALRPGFSRRCDGDEEAEECQDRSHRGGGGGGARGANN